MDDHHPKTAADSPLDTSDRLDSWKAIAAYFGRSTTTVQRWETDEGLPVRRLAHAKKGSVFAFKHELDAWRRDRTSGLPDTSEVKPAGSPRPGVAPVAAWMMSRTRLGLRAGVTASVVVLAVMVTGLPWARARIRGPVLETPAHLDVRTPEAGTVILLWTDTSLMEDRFEISRSGTIVGTVPAGSTKAEFTGLDSGTSYHWDVRACNAGGCSPWHGIVGMTPYGLDADNGTPDLPAVGGADDILFESNRATGRGQIFVMKPDGSRVTRVTNTGRNDVFPSWSPDRTRIAFVSDRSGENDVFVMKADGSGVVNLTNHPAIDAAPSWSPDGTRIAFVSRRSGKADVWVMNADGSNPVNLTASPAIEADPTWSPDGRRIAFSSGRNGADDIYIMNADGSSQARLTTDAGSDTSPAWGPNGRIAFQSRRHGHDDIYVIDADGTRELRLTEHPGADRTPTWAPDGGRILFGSDREGNQDIFSVKPDGTGLVKLTGSPASDTKPAWGFLRLTR